MCLKQVTRWNEIHVFDFTKKRSQFSQKTKTCANYKLLWLQMLNKRLYLQSWSPIHTK